MGIEEPRTDYLHRLFSKNISITLIDDVELILDLGNMTKQLVWSIEDQYHNPRTQTESFKSEWSVLEDQCLQNAEKKDYM